MTVTVFGATGNTGKIVTQHLVKSGATVRAVTRDRQKAADLGAQEVMEWDWREPGAFDKALDGADAAYFMCPVGLQDGSLLAFRDEYSRRFAEAAVRASSGGAPSNAAAPASHADRDAHASAASGRSPGSANASATGRLQRVVQLSSFGADIPTNSGVLEGLYKAERNLAGCAPTRIILRPGYFWQNFRSNVAGVREKNFLGGYPLEPQTKLLFADTTEIGRIAADLLLDTHRQGEQLYYTGHPTLHRFSDIAAALARHLDKPDLAWTNVGYDAARQYMTSQSMPQDLIDNFIAFFACINSGKPMDAYTPDQLIPQHFGLDDFVHWFEDHMAAKPSPASS